MKKMLIVVVAVVVVAAAAVFIFLQMSSGEKEVPVVLVEYSPGDYFTTNVKGSSSHILKATIVLVVNKEGMEEMLTAENTKIRDTIIFILRELDEAAITADGRHDDLRAKIITELNSMLGIDNIVEVRFNDFVMG